VATAKLFADLFTSVLTGVYSYAHTNPHQPPSLGRREMKMQPYISTTSQKFAPGNFVTSDRRIGVTRAIEDVQEANPRVLVKWMDDLSQEWVRSEYLYLAN
jgi:hypothetical protein